MEKDILSKFITNNVEINNLDLFLNSFGQRFLLLKALGREEESEYKQLSCLFEALKLNVSTKENGDIVFTKIVREKSFNSFFKKIKEKTTGRENNKNELNFIEDILNGNVKIFLIEN